MKIHILFTGLDIASHVGGIETYIYKILQKINLHEFQIDFLVYKGMEPCFYKEFLAKGCKFHFVTSRRQNFLKNKREIRNLYKKEKFDVIHCHQNTLSNITHCIEACKLNIPVIIHSRNASLIANPLSKFLHYVNYLRVQRLSITRVAVSDLAGKWMFGNKFFLVLNNGIDTKRYQFSYQSRIAIRKELNIDENSEVIINVGAFRKQKNHRFTIRIFAQYLRLKPTAVLLLVGNGSLKKEIENLVAQLGIDKNVIFLGLRNDIPQILSAADKFLFPSLFEGFPNALLEAECNGLQCIVSNAITKQAFIPELCSAVALDAPLEKWLQAVSQNKKINNRENAVFKIKELGLDIDSEILRLSNLYKQITKKVLD